MVGRSPWHQYSSPIFLSLHHHIYLAKSGFHFSFQHYFISLHAPFIIIIIIIIIISNTDPFFFVILLVLLFQVKAVFSAPWFCNITRKEVSNILTLTHISTQQKFVTFKLHRYLGFNIFTPKASIFLQRAKKKKTEIEKFYYSARKKKFHNYRPTISTTFSRFYHGCVLSSANLCWFGYEISRSVMGLCCFKLIFVKNYYREGEEFRLVTTWFNHGGYDGSD